MQDDEKTTWTDDGADEMTESEQPRAGQGDDEEESVFPDPSFEEPPVLAAEGADDGEVESQQDSGKTGGPRSAAKAETASPGRTSSGFPEPRMDEASTLDDTHGQKVRAREEPDTRDAGESVEGFSPADNALSPDVETETEPRPRETVAEAPAPTTRGVWTDSRRDPEDRTSATNEAWEASSDYGDFIENDTGLVDATSGADVEKMGIVGGKGVGKSYLFQAMVYRCYSGIHAGALSTYLEHDSIRLFSSLKRGKISSVNLARFSKNYANWVPLPQTILTNQKWYRLRLPYRCGFLGAKRSYMEVEYFDGSGEGFFAAMRNAENRRQWRDGYLHARVMVFCLPLWAAFPNSSLTQDDWEERDQYLEEFDQVVENFRDLREEHGSTLPVKTILALTMADDRRSALETLQDKWINPYMGDPAPYLKKLRKGSGVARYLDNARRVSQALYEEFEAASILDPRVGAVPRHLDFHGGKPWLVPVSSIDGSALDSQSFSAGGGVSRGRRAPVPVHVELPLLVALSERCNALL